MKKFHWGLLTICLVTVVLYSPVVRFDFVNFDDPDLLTHHRWYFPLTFKSLLAMWSPMSLWNGVALDYFPLRDMSYALDHFIFGWWPGGYHLTQLFIHVGNVLLIGLILRCFMPETLALAGCALWAWHPLMVEPVAWITGRKDLLMAFFFLLSFFSLLQKNIRWFFLFAICSMLSKYVGFVAALLGFVAWKGEIPTPKVKKTSYFLLGIGTALVLFASSAKIHQESLIQTNGSGGIYTNWPAAFQVFSLATMKMLIPMNLSARYVQNVDLTWSDPQVLLGMLLVLALILISRKSKEALFLLIVLIPYSQFIPIQVWMADRYLYLPVMGVIWFVLSKYPQGLLPILGIVAATFFWGTHMRLPVWKDSYSLWTDTVRKSPGLYSVWGNLAAAEMDRGVGDPVGHLKTALKLNPNWTVGHVQLANAYLTVGDLKNGRDELEQFEKSATAKENFLNLSMSAVAWGMLNENRRAEDYFKKWIAIQNDPIAMGNYGVLLAKTGREPEAFAMWSRALELKPGETTSRHNRAKYWFFHKNCEKMRDDLKGFRFKNKEEQNEIQFMFEHCK